MTQFIVYPLSLLLALLSATTKNIEKSFLQNDPKLVYSQFPAESRLNISLPEPISFSDQLSSQQAYFLFQRIFSRYTTLEFYPESETPAFTSGKNFIFRARWSFKNIKNNNLYVFRVFFYLMHQVTEPIPAKGQTGDKAEKHQLIWKITEIKAERL